MLVLLLLLRLLVAGAWKAVAILKTTPPTRAHVHAHGHADHVFMSPLEHRHPALRRAGEWSLPKRHTARQLLAIGDQPEAVALKAVQPCRRLEERCARGDGGVRRRV